jgi:hypothetical protein
MLLKFPHESARLEALHFHGETKQIKIRLPFTLSELQEQQLFQMIKRLIRIVADINCVQNVPKDLLGQAGQCIGVFEFWGFDTRGCELGLGEAEPNVSLCHRGGRMENINAWYLNTHMVYL